MSRLSINPNDPTDIPPEPTKRRRVPSSRYVEGINELKKVTRDIYSRLLIASPKKIRTPPATMTKNYPSGIKNVLKAKSRIFHSGATCQEDASWSWQCLLKNQPKRTPKKYQYPHLPKRSKKNNLKEAYSMFSWPPCKNSMSRTKQ